MMAGQTPRPVAQTGGGGKSGAGAAQGDLFTEVYERGRS